MAKAVATTGSALPTAIDNIDAPPDFLNDYSTGAGGSTDAADNTVPMISLLQGLSPQVNPRDDAYVEGAQSGDVFLRNCPRPIVKGMDGVHVQPCHFWQDVVEWIPRDDGGGIVDRFPLTKGSPEELMKSVGGVQVVDPRDPAAKKLIWKRGTNELIHTRYYAVRVHGVAPMPLGYVIPFKSSGHKAAKDWMYMITSKISPVTGKYYDIFTSMYELKSSQVKKAGNQWFVYSIKDLGFIRDRAVIEAGRMLHEAFVSGAIKADEADEVASHRDPARRQEPSDDVPL